MLRKVGLAISYFIATVYILSILVPSIYWLRHGFRGTGEGDAFYARLLSYSGWRNRYGLLIEKRHTAHQEKTIMVLGFSGRLQLFSRLFCSV